MVFVDIKLIEIVSLDTGWSVKIDKLIEVAKKIKLCSSYNNSFIIQIAKDIYDYRDSHKPEKKEKNIERVKNFINVVNSINNNSYKYLYFNIDNKTDFWEYIVTLEHSILPRIFKKADGLYLDDGRHRVAALAAKGVKITPMVLVEPICRGTRDQDLKVMLKLGEVLKTKIKDFWESEEWVNYMKTSDFKISIGGIDGT